jgi:hypothetical protein
MKIHDLDEGFWDGAKAFARGVKRGYSGHDKTSTDKASSVGQKTGRVASNIMNFGRDRAVRVAVKNMLADYKTWIRRSRQNPTPETLDEYLKKLGFSGAVMEDLETFQKNMQQTMDKIRPSATDVTPQTYADEPKQEKTQAQMLNKKQVVAILSNTLADAIKQDMVPAKIAQLMQQQEKK